MPEWILSGFGDEICDSFAGQLDAMAQLGLHYIDPRGIDGKNISELTPAEAREARRILEDKGFRVGCIGAPIGKYPLEAPFAPEQERFRRTLENSLALGADKMRIFSFFLPEGRTPEACRTQVLDRLNSLLEEAGSSGVTLLHENEHGIYGDTAERCLDLAESIGSPLFGLIFDPCNFLFAGEQPFPDAYRRLRGRIAALHIKDGKRDKKQVVPAGHGDCRIPELLKALYGDGFSGTVTLEPHLGTFTGLAGFESVLDLSAMPKGGADLFGLALHEFQKAAEDSGYRI